MLGHLIESGPRRRGTPGLRGPTVSLAVHSLLLFGAIVATRHSDFVFKDRPRVDTLVTYQPVPRRPTIKMPDQPVVGPLTLPDAPVTVPMFIPPIDSTVVIDSTTVGRAWAEPPALTLGPPVPDASTVLLNDQVDEPPTVISPPVVEYPDLLRQAGIEGTVVIEAVIDTAGRVEPGSVKVLRSSNHAFEASARAAILGSIYRPGRVGGRLVRVLVNVPVSFTISR